MTRPSGTDTTLDGERATSRGSRDVIGHGESVVEVIGRSREREAIVGLDHDAGGERAGARIGVVDMAAGWSDDGIGAHGHAIGQEPVSSPHGGAPAVETAVAEQRLL